MKLIWLILLIGLMACGGEKKIARKPEHMIDPIVFAEVLADLQIIEAANERKVVPDSTFAKYNDDLFKHVFAKHAIEKEHFDSTFAYLQSNPMIFEGVLDRTIAILNERQVETVTQTK